MTVNPIFHTFPSLSNLFTTICHCVSTVEQKKILTQVQDLRTVEYHRGIEADVPKLICSTSPFSVRSTKYVLDSVVYRSVMRGSRNLSVTDHGRAMISG